MKKLITLLTVLSLFGLSNHYAYASTAGSSAALAATNHPSAVDNRSEILHDYLVTYNSPLAPYAKNFIEEADKNNLDWKLVVSIAGNESQFGQMIPPYSYNGWGYGVYGTNVRYFSSWEEGITAVSKAVRTDYMDKWKATSVYEIGSIYAEDPTWASKVTHYMETLSEFASTYSNTSLSISL